MVPGSAGAASRGPKTAGTVRVLYVSPLKALIYDVERNLRAPLAGIRLAAERLGEPVPQIEVGVRTGDTPADERRHLVRNPPDILITTPESLYLILTSQAAEILRGVEHVIVDEVHALAGTKRGAHLALSLERLEKLTARPPQRIGLSATQRPVETIARFLGGIGPGRAGESRDVADRRRRLAQGAGAVGPGPGRGHEPARRARLPRRTPAARRRRPRTAPEARHSIWPAIHPQILELIREHHSTIVFCNSRRLAERLANKLNELAGEELVRAHHGSLAREQRVQIEEALKAGRAAGDRRHELAGARHRHGRGGSGDPGRVAGERRQRAAARRPGRPPGRRAEPRHLLPQVPRRSAGDGRRDGADARRRDRGDASCRATRSTCWPSRSWP